MGGIHVSLHYLPINISIHKYMYRHNNDSAASEKRRCERKRERLAIIMRPVNRASIRYTIRLRTKYRIFEVSRNASFASLLTPQWLLCLPAGRTIHQIDKIESYIYLLGSARRRHLNIIQLSAFSRVYVRARLLKMCISTTSRISGSLGKGTRRQQNNTYVISVSRACRNNTAVVGRVKEHVRPREINFKYFSARDQISDCACARHTRDPSCERNWLQESDDRYPANIDQS